jgi:potassium-transporting ATPase KdpC subunit
MSDLGKTLFDLLGELMGQPYDDPRCFWGRPCIPREPSLRTDVATQRAESSRSASQWRLQLRLEALGRYDDFSPEAVPAELTNVIAGRFTPFISLPTAAYQVPRVARSRGLEPNVLHELIETHAEAGPAGERRSNILLLNMALDDIRPAISENDPYRSEMGLHRMATNG